MQTLPSIQQTISDSTAVMLYFSAPCCSVCHALKPKLTEAITTHYEKFEIVSIDISKTPDIASHFSVFVIPTIIIFLEGKEFLRESRHMSVAEVIRTIRRPYEIMTS